MAEVVKRINPYTPADFPYKEIHLKRYGGKDGPVHVNGVDSQGADSHSSHDKILEAWGYKPTPEHVQRAVKILKSANAPKDQKDAAQARLDVYADNYRQENPVDFKDWQPPKDDEKGKSKGGNNHDTGHGNGKNHENGKGNKANNPDFLKLISPEDWGSLRDDYHKKLRKMLEAGGIGADTDQDRRARDAIGGAMREKMIRDYLQKESKNASDSDIEEMAKILDLRDDTFELMMGATQVKPVEPKDKLPLNGEVLKDPDSIVIRGRNKDGKLVTFRNRPHAEPGLRWEMAVGEDYPPDNWTPSSAISVRHELGIDLTDDKNLGEGNETRNGTSSTAVAEAETKVLPAQQAELDVDGEKKTYDFKEGDQVWIPDGNDGYTEGWAIKEFKPNDKGEIIAILENLNDDKAEPKEVPIQDLAKWKHEAESDDFEQDKSPWQRFKDRFKRGRDKVRDLKTSATTAVYEQGYDPKKRNRNRLLLLGALVGSAALAAFLGYEYGIHHHGGSHSVGPDHTGPFPEGDHSGHGNLHEPVHTFNNTAEGHRYVQSMLPDSLNQHIDHANGHEILTDHYSGDSVRVGYADNGAYDKHTLDWLHQHGYPTGVSRNPIFDTDGGAGPTGDVVHRWMSVVGPKTNA